MKVTENMLAAAEEQSKKNGKGLRPMQPLTREVWVENISAIFNAMLSAAPTPPEVEPVAVVHESGIGGIIWITLKRPVNGTELFSSSPPSPKASWDAEGNPLNLEAAARDADVYLKSICLGLRGRAVRNNLRKFLKDES